MLAAVVERYGPPEVVVIKDVPKPIPKDNEVLVRIEATTVSSGDWRMRALDLPPGFALIGPLAIGFGKPRQPILGVEAAGTVESVGRSVTRFKAGDKVFVSTDAQGCHAEYIAIAEDGPIAPSPEGLTREEISALSFGGITAVVFLRNGKLKAGERLLVNGASGAVGTALVQIGKHLGAHVTGVTSTPNVELVHSLGADEVVDYKQADFTKSGATYDLIADTVGNLSFATCRGSLNPGGRFLMILGGLLEMLTAPFVNMTGDKKIVAGMASSTADDMRTLAELAVAGKFRPVIDAVYPFEQIVEAHRRVETGRKRGSVVVKIV